MSEPTPDAAAIETVMRVQREHSYLADVENVMVNCVCRKVSPDHDEHVAREVVAALDGYLADAEQDAFDGFKAKALKANEGLRADLDRYTEELAQARDALVRVPSQLAKAWDEGYRQSCADHGDGGRSHGSEHINPYKNRS